ncbi:MAG: thermonuclease family protein [Gammaproteobacteria bacterium]|nr:thermonuclease family protein [Gammaproteobacteria bacterium]
MTRFLVRAYRGVDRKIEDLVSARLKIDVRHHRLKLFWALALVGLVLPWLPSCDTQVQRECYRARVHDGDTVSLICDGETVKVRLHCIDAPEMGQGEWGRASKQHLERILPNRLKLTVKDTDRYGRRVGAVFSTGTSQESINLQMVRAGKAAVYDRYCSDGRYSGAEKQARSERTGIWQRGGDHQRPWAWRRTMKN